jgi:pyruvate kinase
MISRLNPSPWIVAISRDSVVCQGLVFCHGVEPVQLAEDPSNWRDFVRTWLLDHQIQGHSALLVAGPSTRNPEDNYRLEFLHIGESTSPPVGSAHPFEQSESSRQQTGISH